MREPVVLDASALLASLYQEPGGKSVDVALSTAIIGAPNLAEVLSKVDPSAWDDMLAGWSELGLQIESMLPQDAQTVGELASEAPRSGLSLGDRASLAPAARGKGLHG